jgi:4-coumarate--CoA ligase
VLLGTALVPLSISDLVSRAYVVPASPSLTKSDAADQRAFAEKVQRWVGERVAAHKRLRGGVVLVEAIPKRYV